MPRTIIQTEANGYGHYSRIELDQDPDRRWRLRQFTGNERTRAEVMTGCVLLLPGEAATVAAALVNESC
jgi:hypothetical protein